MHEKYELGKYMIKIINFCMKLGFCIFGEFKDILMISLDMRIFE